MDTTIIFTLVLSAFFLGGIVWLVIHSRRQQGAAVREQPPSAQAGKHERRPRTAGGKKTG